MKVAVIDVGSNSVRLMISENGQTLSKEIQITKLALGMKDGLLLTEAVERTVRAVSFFVNKARSLAIEKVYIYATAAVRNAKNQDLFLKKVYELCGLKVDVVDGITESKIGVIGALDGRDGGIIDIGGASTEIAVSLNGEIVYCQSLNVGAVTITDKCGQNFESALNYANSLVGQYGVVPNVTFHGIGGTATTISAVVQELEPYDPTLVHGSKIDLLTLQTLADKLCSLSVEERKQLKGLQPDRADVIAGGCAIMLAVMDYLNIDHFYVSEKDNLEGYLIYNSEKL